MVLRGAIMAHAPDEQRLLGGEVELDESCFGGKREGNGAWRLRRGPGLWYPGKGRTCSCGGRPERKGRNAPGHDRQEGAPRQA